VLKNITSVAEHLGPCCELAVARPTTNHPRADHVTTMSDCAVPRDMKRFNDYFCDKEEEVVIWIAAARDKASMQKRCEKQLCHVIYIHLHGADRSLHTLLDVLG
jgi:hypothetical protein